jgi:hypothetical protein
MNETEMKLKKKYRVGKQYQKHAYRTRTGPMCCNAGCPSGKKKHGKKFHL